MEENKKETKKWFNALGRSTPFGGTKFGLTRSISNVSENVKPLLVSLKAYSEAEKKDHAKFAKEFFGETNNRNENGYITTDCTKLDFSDHHEGAPGEHRYVDHSDTRGEAAVQVELERYYGKARALLAQNEAFLKEITEALVMKKTLLYSDIQAIRGTAVKRNPAVTCEAASRYDAAEIENFPPEDPEEAMRQKIMRKLEEAERRRCS